MGPEVLPPGPWLPSTASWKALLLRAVLALAVGGGLVTFCYFFVDRPVAFFVHDQHISRLEFLQWMTYTPMWFNASAPVVVVLAVIRLAWAPLSRLERTLFAASISLMFAVFCEFYLKMLFGRYWPETWTENNPSLIGDGAYGFHPFHSGPWFGSFPSGHTLRAVSFLSVFWIVYPRWWSFWAAVCLSVIVGLVGMNYHFVGDTVGGAFLGALTGTYTTRFFRLAPARPDEAAGTS